MGTQIFCIAPDLLQKAQLTTSLRMKVCHLGWVGWGGGDQACVEEGLSNQYVNHELAVSLESGCLSETSLYVGMLFRWCWNSSYKRDALPDWRL